MSYMRQVLNFSRMLEEEGLQMHKNKHIFIFYDMFDQ